MSEHLLYLDNLGHLHAHNFAEFAARHGKTEDEVIKDLVDAGWTQGHDENGWDEYWEPEISPDETKPHNHKPRNDDSNTG